MDSASWQWDFACLTSEVHSLMRAKLILIEAFAVAGGSAKHTKGGLWSS